MINDVTSSTIGAAPAAPAFLSLDQLQTQCPAAFALAPHERVSSKYQFVPTTEIVSRLEEYGYKPVSSINPLRKANGKTGPLVTSLTGVHSIRFEPEIQPSGASKIGRIQVVMVNSHDRTRRFNLSAGFFRLVCSNGLVAYRPETSVTATHISGGDKAIYERIEASITEAGKLLTVVKAMAKVNLSKAKQITFAKQAMELRFGDEKLWRILPAQLLAPRRPEDEGDDLWRVFNRIQENAVRGGIHNANTPMPTMPLVRPRQEFNFNSRLWAAAEALVS